MQTDADYYSGEEFKNSPPTVAIPNDLTMGPRAAVARRNGAADMGNPVTGEKQWQNWAQDLNDQEDAATLKA